MRRLYPLLLLLLTPLAAAGQTAVGNNAMAQYLLSQQPSQLNEVEPGVVVPLWLAPNGHLLALKANRGTGAEALRSDTPLSFQVVDTANVVSTGLQYGLAPHLQAHLGVQV